MSITVSSDRDVTVITVKADLLPTCSLTCQILQTFCYSPLLCSVYKGLMQSNVTAALGTIQIMVGVMNIGLGFGRVSQGPADVGMSFWMGGVFIMTGIVSIVAGQLPSLMLVSFAVCVNIAGAVLAVYGCMQYSRDMAYGSVYQACVPLRGSSNNECIQVQSQYLFLSVVVTVVLMVLAALHCCVCLSFTVLGIKAVATKMKEESEAEDEQPLLKEDLLTSPDA